MNRAWLAQDAEPRAVVNFEFEDNSKIGLWRRLHTFYRAPCCFIRV